MRIPERTIQPLLDQLDEEQKNSLRQIRNKTPLTGEDFQNTFKTLLKDTPPDTKDTLIKALMKRAKIKPDQTLTTKQTNDLNKWILCKV
jgi:hypothetical protein